MVKPRFEPGPGQPNRRPYDLMDGLTLKARNEIMAQEDAAIFAAMESLVLSCRTEGHPGFGKPMSECDHPDCVTGHVHEV